LMSAAICLPSMMVAMAMSGVGKYAGVRVLE
jgi:hypothetical protein